MRRHIIDILEQWLAWLRPDRPAYPAMWLNDLFRRQPACAQEEHDARGCAHATYRAQQDTPNNTCGYWPS